MKLDLIIDKSKKLNEEQSIQLKDEYLENFSKDARSIILNIDSALKKQKFKISGFGYDDEPTPEETGYDLMINYISPIFAFHLDLEVREAKENIEVYAFTATFGLNHSVVIEEQRSSPGVDEIQRFTGEVAYDFDGNIVNLNFKTIEPFKKRVHAFIDGISKYNEWCFDLASEYGKTQFYYDRSEYKIVAIAGYAPVIDNPSVAECVVYK
jgi:hypothetical protein